MLRIVLLSAVLAINLHYGSALVTMSPALAKIVPTNLPPLKEEFIVCFNKYWDLKERLGADVRRRWNCTDGCAKAQECCISYAVWDTLSTIKLTDVCNSQALNMIRMFLPMALNQIQDRCEPEFTHGSDQCLALKVSLPPLPAKQAEGEQGTCARKVCTCL